MGSADSFDLDLSTIEYEPPTAGELGSLMEGPGVSDAMEDRAQSAMEDAVATAPVDTGDYRSRFRVERDRGEARLVNDDEAAAAIEWGTEDTPAHHTLTQAADRIEHD